MLNREAEGLNGGGADVLVSCGERADGCWVYGSGTDGVGEERVLEVGGLDGWRVGGAGEGAILVGEDTGDVDAVAAADRGLAIAEDVPCESGEGPGVPDVLVGEVLRQTTGSAVEEQTVERIVGRGSGDGPICIDDGGVGGQLPMAWSPGSIANSSAMEPCTSGHQLAVRSGGRLPTQMDRSFSFYLFRHRTHF